MRQILTLAMAVYWLAHYAYSAVEAGQSLGTGFGAALMLATAHAVAATGFLWLATECVLDGEAVEEVATLAIAAATLLLAGTAILETFGVPQFGTVDGPILVAALAASYAAIRLEFGLRDQRQAENDYSPQVARLMAAGAAHGSMLSRITRRPSETVET